MPLLFLTHLISLKHIYCLFLCLPCQILKEQELHTAVLKGFYFEMRKVVCLSSVS